ncbi:hypothetical protein LCGC14_1076170 [marine sediment metagenome]|uniref:Uncharacterized protein n=1 Tax=marine sediment metagenome TaxID=412755 RepID=A0A0F9QMF2_9ZZZZ
MIVNVTQDHIKRGIQDDMCSCPIALALLPSMGGVTVAREYVATRDHGEFDLPPEAQQFIRDFDAGWMVYPISFEMTRRE